jgi:phosphate transport system substrate-binding protein
MKKQFTVIRLVLLVLSLSTLTQAATLINGAGASFPYPLYTKWFTEYQKTEKEVQINYQSIGSGGGIKQFLEGTVDFGASDAPMTDEQIAKAKNGVLHIPTVLGAVVVTYQLPEIKTPLKLNGEVLSEIFLGKITKWEDPKIKKLNPEAPLKGDILVVHRSDGSGTSNIFTEYLAKVSPEWKTKVGVGTSVNWPVGLGGKGNEGVAGLVKQTEGSVGYVELIYADNNKLPSADLQNSAGDFVSPSLKSVSAAAASLKKMPEDFRVSITNAEGKASYPISGFTYLLISKSQKDQVKGAGLVKFLKWAMTKGQGFAEGLSYAPLPKSLVKKVEAKIGTIEVPKASKNQG